MPTLTKRLALISEGGFHVFNLTEDVKSVIKESGIQEGAVLVFYRHSTGAIMIVEHEAGILVDLEDVLERIVPVDNDYKHHLREYDNNGAAHVRTGLLNVSVTIPILNYELQLGDYQEILVIDMDPGTKSRSVLVQVCGD